MKKVLLLTILTALLLVGCSSNKNEASDAESSKAKSTTDYESSQTPNTVDDTNDTDKVQPSSSISDAQAKEIALAQVPGGTITEFEYDGDDSTPEYEITLTKDNYKYKIKIDALNGSIIENKQEILK